MSDRAETQSDVSEPVKQTMDITEIMSILPHRYPFLLIDRVVEIERRKRLVAIKNVTANEPQFTGHFPGYPIMPGVLIVEGMAQAGGALMMPEFPNRDELLLLFTSIEDAKFRRPVVPGDQLRIEAKVLNWRRLAVKIKGVATVEGKVVCEATLMCMLIPNPVKQDSAKQVASGQVAAQTASQAEAQPPALEPSPIAQANEEKPQQAASVPLAEPVLS